MDIGTLIKVRRKELNMTQEELCAGICEPVTISRIENGKQIPSTEHLKAILERLNLPTQQIICLVPSNTFSNQSQFKEVLDEIDSYFQLSNHKTEVTYQSLVTKISEIECNDIQSKQLKFFLISTIQFSNENFDKNLLIKKTINYIKLSFSDFNEKNIYDRFLTYNEFVLLLLLSVLYYSVGNIDSSGLITSQLIYQIDTHYSFQNNSDIIVKFVLIFIFFTIKSNQYSIALKIGRFTKNQCIKYQQFKYLGNLYEQLSLYTTNIEERNDYINKAYYMYVSTENENGVKRINELKKKLNL